MNLTKEQFIRLANAYQKDDEYISTLDSFMRENAERFGIETDFLGLDFGFGSNLFREVYSLLQDEDDNFGYWLCECDKDWDKFNKNITLLDGTHPNCHSFEDLYDFMNSENQAS